MSSASIESSCSMYLSVCLSVYPFIYPSIQVAVYRNTGSRYSRKDDIKTNDPRVSTQSDLFSRLSPQCSFLSLCPPTTTDTAAAPWSWLFFFICWCFYGKFYFIIFFLKCRASDQRNVKELWNLQLFLQNIWTQNLHSDSGMYYRIEYMLLYKVWWNVAWHL